MALPRAGSFCPFRANFPRAYHLPHIYNRPPHIYNRPHHIYNRAHHIYNRPHHIYIGALIALLFSLSLTLAAQTDRGANFPSAIHLAQKGNAEGRKKLTASLDSLHRYGIRALRLTVPLAAPEANDSAKEALNFLLRAADKRAMKVAVCLTAGEGADLPTAAAALRDILAAKCFTKTNAVETWEFHFKAFAHAFGADARAGLDSLAHIVRAADADAAIGIYLAPSASQTSDRRDLQAALTVDGASFLGIDLLPVERRWSSTGALFTSLPNVYIRSREYLESVVRRARQYGKAVVIDAFCYPRDRNALRAGSPTDCRNAFFNFVLQLLLQGGSAPAAPSRIFFGQYTADEAEAAEGDGACNYAVYPSDASTLRIFSSPK